MAAWPFDLLPLAHLPVDTDHHQVSEGQQWQGSVWGGEKQQGGSGGGRAVIAVAGGSGIWEGWQQQGQSLERHRAKSRGRKNQRDNKGMKRSVWGRR